MEWAYAVLRAYSFPYVAGLMCLMFQVRVSVSFSFVFLFAMFNPHDIYDEPPQICRVSSLSIPKCRFASKSLKLFWLNNYLFFSFDIVDDVYDFCHLIWLLPVNIMLFYNISFTWATICWHGTKSLRTHSTSSQSGELGTSKFAKWIYWNTKTKISREREKKDL